MLHIIQDYLKSILPAKRKTSPNGWISFNGVCCVHNGETADKRGRAGIIANPDGSVSYSCFNCKYKASFQPGRPLTYKFRKLLGWMGAPDGEIKRLVIEAIRLKDLVNPDEIKESSPEEKIEFKHRTLPKDAKSFDELITFYELNSWQNVDKFYDATEYIHSRKIDLRQYPFYLSNDTAHSLCRRIIIPFTWNNEIIGYTARALSDDVTPKYHNNYEGGYVFNVDKQHKDWKIVIVCEGPFDAMAIDGVAVLGNEVNETQADIIDSLGKEVIVVADNDKAGNELINAALEYGWNVSFPIWLNDCKDINDAVVKYGKLFVLQSIIKAKETSRLKIELRQKLHG